MENFGISVENPEELGKMLATSSLELPISGEGNPRPPRYSPCEKVVDKRLLFFSISPQGAGRKFILATQYLALDGELTRVFSPFNVSSLGYPQIHSLYYG